MTNQIISGIAPIADAIIKLDRASGEAALSQNMSPIFIKAGVKFDTEEMTDANGCLAETEDMVVGCIELGLGSTERRDSGKLSSRDISLLLKPVVLLTSAFYDH